MRDSDDGFADAVSPQCSGALSKASSILVGDECSPMEVIRLRDRCAHLEVELESTRRCSVQDTNRGSELARLSGELDHLAHLLENGLVEDRGQIVECVRQAAVAAAAAASITAAAAVVSGGGFFLFTCKQHSWPLVITKSGFWIQRRNFCRSDLVMQATVLLTHLFLSNPNEVYASDCADGHCFQERTIGARCGPAANPSLARRGKATSFHAAQPQSSSFDWLYRSAQTFLQSRCSRAAMERKPAAGPQQWRVAVDWGRE